MASPDHAASAVVIVENPSVPPALVSEATALEYQPILRIDIGVVDSSGGDFDQDLPVPRAGYGNICPVIEFIQTTVARKQRSCHNLR